MRLNLSLLSAAVLAIATLFAGNAAQAASFAPSPSAVVAGEGLVQKTHGYHRYWRRGHRHGYRRYWRRRFGYGRRYYGPRYRYHRRYHRRYIRLY